ncbi:MAG: S-layer homology domain-containing protein [Spirulina sp. SIO3F2]|nr:S-layer homology domain-containing protein [Spirulina sp. SIO3F2]
MQGYPDGTFRGEPPVSRDEFAAGLAACLRPFARSIADFATTEELDAVTYSRRSCSA